MQSVSLAAISVWLKKYLRMSYKRASKHFRVNNSDIRDKTIVFAERMRNISIDNLISIDETSVYFTDHSKYGWTRVGTPLKPIHFPNRACKKRVTLVMAVSASRVMHYEFYSGSCNSEHYITLVAFQCSKHQLRPSNNTERQKARSWHDRNQLFVCPLRLRSPFTTSVHRVIANDSHNF